MYFVVFVCSLTVAYQLGASANMSPCKGHKNLAGQKRHVHCGHSPCDSDSRRVLCVTSRAKLNVTNKREEPSVSCLRGLVLQAHSKMNTLNTLCSSQTGTTQTEGPHSLEDDKNCGCARGTRLACNVMSSSPRTIPRLRNGALGVRPCC